MKLWYNTTKRIAKKKIRKRWTKLNFGRGLKPGDLVSTCIGYNEHIVEITPEWTSRGLSQGEYVYDFEIITESGNCCSLIHCCTVPTETKEEIVAYWRQFISDEGLAWVEEMRNKGWTCWDKIPEALLKGQEVFDENGRLLQIHA